MVHQHFSLEIRLFLWLISREKFKAVHVDSILEQTVIPLVVEVRLSRNDPDASPLQGENQCYAPIMLAMYKFLFSMPSLSSKAIFWRPNLWGETFSDSLCFPKCL